jgi:hypothetical protein
VRPALAAVVTVALCMAQRHVARACGVSASGAPAGICDASDVLDEKAAAARNRIGASFGYTSSVLFFSDGLRAPTERDTVMVSFEHPMRDKHGSRWTLEVGAGSLLDGYLLVGGTKAMFLPGVIADVSLSHLIIDPSAQSTGGGRRYASPFLLLALTLAGVWSRTSIAGATSRPDYVAFDFSAEAAAGVSMKVAPQTALTPFLAARLFGGPVFWTHQTETAALVVGTDAYKYSLGPGLAIARRTISLSIGCSLLGEKNVRAGLSVAF